MNKMLPDPGTWEEYVETFKAGKGERKKTALLLPNPGADNRLASQQIFISLKVFQGSKCISFLSINSPLLFSTVILI